jgi:hypothetical protein
VQLNLAHSTITCKIPSNLAYSKRLAYCYSYRMPTIYDADDVYLHKRRQSEISDMVFVRVRWVNHKCKVNSDDSIEKLPCARGGFIYVQ